MSRTLEPPQSVLRDFDISTPVFLEETAIATLWKVRRRNQQHAVLKVYNQKGMGNERLGFAFLSALEGTGCAHIYASNQTAAVMEWLPGPSLGDLKRSGQDHEAATQLVAVARQLHSAPPPRGTVFPKLTGWFDALFTLEITPECAPQARANILRCQDLARHLLSTQTDMRPLHGDLHQDNIRKGARGYCAFDAKGVFGERTYELANAFRNPKGAAELVRNPDRLRHLRRLWSRQFDVDPQRLQHWAAAKCALSIAWRCKGRLTFDPELDLLDMFLSTMDETQG